MPRYETFSYEEILSELTLEKMPDSLKVKGDKDPEILLIIRLLSGSLRLHHHYSEVNILNRINYFSSDFKSFGQNWRTKFPKIISEDVTSNDLSDYIDTMKYTNKAFYQMLLSEISQFFIHTKKESHTSAFIFIYRLLEKISYAFPLIYTSKTSDFIRSFNLLKDLMTGDKEKKELGFFKMFVEKLYSENSIKDTSVDINILASNEQVQSQMYKMMKMVCDEKIIHEDTNEPRNLSIKYCDMGSFIISVRNRFFHNLNGGARNIESSSIVDSDEFFKLINPVSMRWISMIFIEILSYNISEFQRIRQSCA